jgi:hypothetical protein
MMIASVTSDKTKEITTERITMRTERKSMHIEKKDTIKTLNSLENITENTNEIITTEK